MQSSIAGKAYVLGDNVDTDQIIPAQYLTYNPSIPEEYRMFGKYALCGVPDDAAGLPKDEADAWEAAEWSGDNARWREGSQHPTGKLQERFVNFYRDRAAVRALSPGKYRFKVFGTSIAIEPELVDATPGVNPEIALRWHMTK